MNLPFRTNEIQLNVPAKVLLGSVTSSSVDSFWNYPNGSDDKWWLLGSNPRGWRYVINLNITPKTHGSHLTRKPFEYNGMDIKVGDWIGWSSDGVCMKIVSVPSKTETSVVVIAEDYQRYNTFKSVAGTVLGSGNDVVIFELQESGLPVIDPLPTGPGNNFQTNIGARFTRQNIRDNFELEVINNSFTKGDVVSAYDGNITLTDSTTASNMIGVVSMPGPGPDYVTIRPHSRFVDYDTTMPLGTVGQKIYVSNAGDLTLESDSGNTTGSTAFIIVQESQPTVLTGTVNNPAFATTPFSIDLNDETISFTGTETLVQIASAIGTQSTIVTASAPRESVSGVSGTLSTAYGLVGGYVPFAATINGVAVDFTSDYYGNLRYGQPVAAPEDMALAINNANIPNITATAPGDGTLTITDATGTGITIVNTQLDNTGTGGSGVGFAGTNSVTGIPLSTAQSNNFRLRLTREDGGAIEIYDSALYFENQTGLTSGQNGRPQISAFVYDGLRTASTTVVADITDRDVLTPGIGDMVHVLDDGTGSYALYLWDGTAWRQLATEESAYVDARSYEVSYSVGDSTTILLGNVSVNRKIESISADVTVAFDDASANVLVGTVGDPDLLFTSNYGDLGTISTYKADPEFFTSDPGGQDTPFYVTIDPQAATVGNVTVTITYV